MTDHWRCPACGIFDGPVSLGRCDVCVDERDELVDVEAWVRSSGSAAQNHEGENSGQRGMREYLATARRPSMAARSPQGEDHEAGKMLAVEALARSQRNYEGTVQQVERVLAAYLSRCPSPERNTEKP